MLPHHQEMLMNNLVKVIGPAPSELSFEDFCTRLTEERNRVKEAIRLFNERRIVKRSASPKKPASKKTKGAQKMASMSKELNLKPEEMLRILEEIENEQTSK